MWKLLKLTVFIVVIAIVTMVATGYKVKGVPVLQFLQTLSERDDFKESIKDLRILVGESIKALGEEISVEVTKEERKELADAIKEELEEGKAIKGAKNQKALKPKKNNSY